ncbi:MAG: hypothetical protein IPK83_01455 [Planctomycetes bacterium]|nr:hypothetical protein [Planctomycetota bacterium]
MFTTVTYVLVFIAFALPELLLLRRGLRGVRVHDRPLCRNCLYELSGRGADSTRCSECGADVSSPEAVQIGVFRRRRALIFAGCLFGLIALGVGGRLND